MAPGQSPDGVAHVLLSRFNLSQGMVWTDNPFRPGAREAWCARRRDLFVNITLPSVLAQDMRKFHWLIWFSPKLNEPVEQVLEEIAPHRFITPVFLDTFQQPAELFLDSMRSEIADVTGDADLVCSTRVDTDDALNRRHMRRIQRAARRRARSADGERFSLNSPFGVQFADGRFFACPRDCNNFLSMVETPGPEMVTALGIPHARARRYGPVHQIFDDEPMWMAVVHGGNVAKTLGSGVLPMADGERLREMFGVLDLDVASAHEGGHRPG